MEFKPEDIIAIVLLALSFLALYLGKVTWEQILPILTIIIGFYFGVMFGYKRSMEAVRRKLKNIIKDD
jgi:Kef-type K+ transport system membrane component KefB